MFINSCFYCNKPKGEETFSWSSLTSWINPFFITEVNSIGLEAYFCNTCLEEIEACRKELLVEGGCLRCHKPNQVNYAPIQNLSQVQQDYSLLEEQFIKGYSKFFFMDEEEHQMLFSNLCYDCLRWLENQDNLLFNRSALANKEWVREALVRYKYRQDVRWRYIFASFLVEEIKRLQQYHDFDYLITIPLNPSRLSERHFDHIYEIGALISNEVDLPLVNWLVVKEKNSQKQSKQSRQERIQNLLEKFIKNSSINVDIVNKSILLIDDIYTTGSTLHAAAHCLKAAGAKVVISVCLARST